MLVHRPVVLYDAIKIDCFKFYTFIIKSRLKELNIHLTSIYKFGKIREITPSI